MNQFNATALNHPLASSGSNHPPRNSGVRPMQRINAAQHHTNTAAMLGGQL
jgi:hypothetical protein